MWLWYVYRSSSCTVQVNRPIAMKKEGIQTRNRKMTTKPRRASASVRPVGHVTSPATQRIDVTSSRRLYDSLRPATTNVYDSPDYYHTFPVQHCPETVGFYPSHASGPQGYGEYGEAYPGDYTSTHDKYLSAVASCSQQYLFHRHLHDLLWRHHLMLSHA